MLKDRPDHPVRRALVVLSDGEDNQSEVSQAQAIEMAQRAEVIVYAISTDDSGLILRGDRVLDKIASATGGRAFFPFKMKDITHSFAAIEDELRSQYVVSYRPADFDADGRYRSIQISALKKDLQVRAAQGLLRTPSISLSLVPPQIAACLGMCYRLVDLPFLAETAHDRHRPFDRYCAGGDFRHRHVQQSGSTARPCRFILV